MPLRTRMNMFNKFYFKISKTLFLTTILCHSYSAVSAENTVNSDRDPSPIYQLNRIIESTNLVTQDYIWKFELQPDPQTSQVQVKLLNPNSQFEQLNQRAISIAKTVTYSQLADQHKRQLTQSLTSSTAKTAVWPLQYTDRFYLDIQFPNRIIYKRRPDFKNLNTYIYHLCKITAAEEQSTSPLINQYNRKFMFKLYLTLTAEGNYQTYRIRPKIADQEFLKRLSTDLQRIKFSPNNIDGRPTAFQVSQPVEFACAD